jgi:hypothetical protein
VALARGNKRRQLYQLLVMAVLALGVFVRVWHFPAMPPGLNQDEAASAYEAYALAETGNDKWGNHLPVYFSGWGSGQNVLQAYLTVPVVRVLGLTVLSARLVPLLLGLLTLPLLYYCLRPWGRYPALLGLLLLAVAPWHFMLSRWALESNIAPFWMLLGCTALSRAISTQRRRWIIPCLVPFALALYAYGITFIVLPGMLALVLGCCLGRLRRQAAAWLLAMGLFGLVAGPFFLFVLKNYVLHSNLAWTDKLFFSTPLLSVTRLSQIEQDSWRDVYEANSTLMLRGFDETMVYNRLPGYPLLLRFTWALAALGFFTMLYRLGRWRSQLAERPADVLGLVFLAWGLGCLPLLFLFPLNINRVNHVFVPCVALAAWVTSLVIKNFRAEVPKSLIRGLVLGWFALEGGLAARYYFVHYPQVLDKKHFNSSLPAAFAALGRLQGVSQVRITTQLRLPYVYTLFYLRYPPAQFRREVHVKLVQGTYEVSRFGKYVFDPQYLAPGRAYGYLARKTELAADGQGSKQIVFSNEDWEVGIRYPRAQE